MLLLSLLVTAEGAIEVALLMEVHSKILMMRMFEKFAILGTTNLVMGRCFQHYEREN